MKYLFAWGWSKAGPLGVIMKKKSLYVWMRFFFCSISFQTASKLRFSDAGWHPNENGMSFMIYSYMALFKVQLNVNTAHRIIMHPNLGADLCIRLLPCRFAFLFTEYIYGVVKCPHLQFQQGRKWLDVSLSFHGELTYLGVLGLDWPTPYGLFRNRMVTVFEFRGSQLKLGLWERARGTCL